MGWAARKRQNEIKAIETEYNGYHFRSRTEARWAVFFDAIGLSYEYEREGFNLHENGYYLPDFYLKDWDWFIEIKGGMPKREEIEKVKELSYSGQSRGAAILWGSPWPPRFEIKNKPKTYPHFYGPDDLRMIDGHAALCFYSPETTYFAPGVDPGYFHNIYHAFIHKGKGRGIKDIDLSFLHPEDERLEHPELLEAYRQARSARFEHGENPVVIPVQHNKALVSESTQTGEPMRGE